MILWAKDVGWAYNAVVQNNSGWYGGGDNNNGSYLTIRNLVEINPSGPVLASVFGPGKYPEFAAEQQLRYPPATLYYNLISSPEYGSFPEQRFRKNIDSIYRLFLGQPASESNIAWAKNQFLNGGGEWFSPFNPTTASWINPQWEPNGQLIASNFQYVDAVEFLTNPRYITDDVYGIRHIPGEIDAVCHHAWLNYWRKMRRRSSGRAIISSAFFPACIACICEERLPMPKLKIGARAAKISATLNSASISLRNMARRRRLPTRLRISTVTISAKTRQMRKLEPTAAKPFLRLRIKSVFGRIIGIALSFIPVVGAVITTFTPVGNGLDPFSHRSIARINNIVPNSISKGFNEAGFDGDTFVGNVSIARGMAGQAGGVFSMTNLMENADPTILDGFRTMALAPQTPQGNVFAGLASPFAAVAGLFGAKQETPDRAHRAD